MSICVEFVVISAVSTLICQIDFDRVLTQIRHKFAEKIDKNPAARSPVVDIQRHDADETQTSDQIQVKSSTSFLTWQGEALLRKIWSMLIRVAICACIEPLLKAKKMKCSVKNITGNSKKIAKK